MSAAGLTIKAPVDEEPARHSAMSATIPAYPQGNNFNEPRTGEDGVIISLNLKGDRFEQPTKDGLEYAPPSKLMRTLNPDDRRTKALTSA